MDSESTSQPPDGRDPDPSAQLSAEDQRAREAFIATKRHDLRTPINAIIGYGEMLLEDAENDGATSLAADLGKISKAGHVLLRTVNDLLDPAKIDTGQVDLADIEGLGARIRHEMRDHINTVRGYSELLLEDAEGDNEREEFVSDLRKIHAAASRLLELISEIINFTEVISGKVEISTEQAEASSLVRDVVATIERLDSQRVGRDERPGRILVVDDNETNRDLLAKRLKRGGHAVAFAVNGQEALDRIGRDQGFEVILLDIMMPVMDGYQVLQRLKADESTQNVPVIMLSALDQIDSVVRCIEMGADDFLPKPFNPVLLEARIGACLEKKRFRDKEQEYLEEIRVQREKADQLLLNILPAPIVEELKRTQGTVAESFDQVTVLFADLVGFTSISARLTPEEIVERLNAIFKTFDSLADRHGVEKIKTIGDAYMVAAGLPTPQPDHAERIARMALDILQAIDELNETSPDPFRIRIGVNTGHVVAGVIGTKKFAYDLWGDTVNTSSRMESHGVSGRIQVSESTYLALQGKGYELEPRGTIDVKGKGEMKTYFLNGLGERTDEMTEGE